MTEHNNKGKIILKTVLITLVVIISIFFIAAFLWSNSEITYYEGEANCSNYCLHVPLADSYSYGLNNNLCYCYDNQSRVLYSGEI